MPQRKKDNSKLEISLPRPLLEAVNARLTLRYNGKRQFGAISRLTELLFRQWLEGEAKADPMRPESLVLNDLIEETKDGNAPSPSATSD